MVRAVVHATVWSYSQASLAGQKHRASRKKNVDLFSSNTGTVY
jgi:hypothetical protein